METGKFYHVVAGNFPLSLSFKFLRIFVDISGSNEPITLIWAPLERSFSPAELEYRCQFWSKAMTSEAKQGSTIVTVSYSQHRSQWVNILDKV